MVQFLKGPNGGMWVGVGVGVGWGSRWGCTSNGSSPENGIPPLPSDVKLLLRGIETTSWIPAGTSQLGWSRRPIGVMRACGLDEVSPVCFGHSFGVTISLSRIYMCLIRLAER